MHLYNRITHVWKSALFIRIHDSNGTRVMEENTSNRNEILKKIPILKSPDRRVRKNALEEIKKKIKVCSSVLSEEEMFGLVSSIHVPILTSLSDPVENCRELAVEILRIVIDSLSKFETLLPPIIASLVSALTSPDSSETSEEVRLLEVMLLTMIVDYSSENALFRFLNDIVHILATTIVDPCPEVKRQSCLCASSLAESLQSKFHMVSGTLVKPLLQTISHQHSKTRVACINTIGSVLLHGNNQHVQDVVSHFAQRLFDHSPSVRLAVVEVVGNWLLNLPDRYSFFHRLIPLLLSSISDDVEDVSFRAKILWNDVGVQYVEENIKEFKGQVDFPTPVPDDYPCKDGQPNLGCRALVQRNLCNILPPLLHDLQDWVPETRVKSSMLLYQLLLHAESNATSNLQIFLQGICFAAKNQEKNAVQMALKTAELLGYFIEPNLWCKNFLSDVRDAPTAVHLNILAAILRGCGKKPLDDNYESVCGVLADPFVCRTRTGDEQAYLLLCIEAVLLLPDKVDSSASQMLFTVLVSVLALSCTDSITEKAKCLMEYLADIQCLESVSHLFHVHTMPLLKEVTINHELWTPLSPEVAIFSFLIQSCDNIEEISDFSIPILIKNLEPGKEVKLRSLMLTVVTVVLEKLPATQEFSASSFSLMQHGIFPNITWQAGKTASALRTIAIACLWKIINGKQFSENMMSAVGDELLSKLVSQIDDESFSIRLLVCKIMEYILPTLVRSIDEHKIHTLCLEFLKLMDDLKDEIRMWTVKVFKAYFKSFTSEYNWNTYRAHVKEIYKIMLIHMDDNENSMRQAICNLLKDAACVCPDVLLKECESVRHVFRFADECEKLIEHVNSLKIHEKQ